MFKERKSSADVPSALCPESLFLTDQVAERDAALGL